MAKKNNKAKAKSGGLTARQKRNFFIVFWALFLVGIGSAVLVFTLIANGAIGHLPPVEELQNPKNKYASEIISSDGELLGTFFTAKDNRISSEYVDLSPHLVNALIATEDARFEEHSGIDGIALAACL